LVKLLFLCGSPREMGNSEKAVNYARDKAAAEGIDTDTFFISGKKVAPCNACGFCNDKDGCVITDDMTEFCEKALDADAIIVASPVYFGTVSAQLKAVFDRSRILRRKFKLKSRLGAAIACGRSRNGGQETTIQTIHNWMNIHAMKVLGDGSHYGATIVSEFDNDKEGKKTVDDMIAFVIECIKEGSLQK
jgi:multimeric flavodoxin WrbA